VTIANIHKTERSEKWMYLKSTVTTPCRSTRHQLNS